MDDSLHGSSSATPPTEEEIAIETQLHPPWREGVERFLIKGFKPGDVVSREWVYQAFDIPMPDDDMPNRKAKRLELQFLGQWGLFWNALLEDHQIFLKTKVGQGWIVVPPNEQTEAAYEQGMRELKTAMRRMASGVMNIDYAKLSNDKRQENIKARMKLQQMADMTRPRRVQLLPDVKENE